ncbi:MAG: NADH-quinone oxidoreductase subunit K [Verrucomicrobiae bacterium]|nr:NADH-quinone oxidoreductase subunit K [Verrucomicrobiae bacterium]
MALDTILLVGVLVTCGTYLLLQRSFVRILFGFLILSNAANLFVLCTSGEPGNRLAPILDGRPGPRVDPLPQALILTAIVIGFGVTAYLVVLLYRLFLDHGTTNAADLYPPDPSTSEPLPPEES